VPQINVTATQRITCSGRAGMILPDRRDVALVGQSTWPLFPNTMPWAAKIDEIQEATVVHLVDNTATIDSELAKWNTSQSWPPPSTTGGGPATTVGTGAGGANGAGPLAVDNGSCGCRTVGSRGSSASPWALAALAGLVARFARRRARK